MVKFSLKFTVRNEITNIKYLGLWFQTLLTCAVYMYVYCACGSVSFDLRFCWLMIQYNMFCYWHSLIKYIYTHNLKALNCNCMILLMLSKLDLRYFFSQHKNLFVQSTNSFNEYGHEVEFCNAKKVNVKIKVGFYFLL